LLAVSLARHDLYPDVEGGVDSEIGFLGFSLRGRHPYLPEESKVIYGSKDDKDEKVFDALEWLAAMGSHVPYKGEQMVR
jgi:hypothetical protein